MHLITLPLIFGAAQAILVPPPSGPYDVAVKHFELIDPDRIDPFAPEPNTKRRFMASAYLPVDSRFECETEIVPYMPPVTAAVFGELSETLGVPKELVAEFELELCNISTVDIKNNTEKKQFPVAVFSPGIQGNRLAYGALARSQASLGNIVITPDHTYEALVVEFPNGDVAYNPDPEQPLNETVILQSLEVRTGDESFLISQLSNETFTDPIFANFPGTFDPHNVVAYGHSFGGAASASAALTDPNVAGGINFDGTIYGPVVEEGLDGKPFVLVTRAPSNGTAPISEWNELYNNIDAAKMELAVMNTEHYAFCDVPLLLTAYDMPPESQPMVDQVFGTLDGRKVEKAMNEIVSSLLELVFNNNTKPLKQVDSNPDIDILLSDLSNCK